MDDALENLIIQHFECTKEGSQNNLPFQTLKFTSY